MRATLSQRLRSEPGSTTGAFDDVTLTAERQARERTGGPRSASVRPVGSSGDRTGGAGARSAPTRRGARQPSAPRQYSIVCLPTCPHRQLIHRRAPSSVWIPLARKPTKSARVESQIEDGNALHPMEKYPSGKRVQWSPGAAALAKIRRLAAVGDLRRGVVKRFHTSLKNHRRPKGTVRNSGKCTSHRCMLEGLG